jgi:trimethylamine--corrinoid protein Co-methyltransferase
MICPIDPLKHTEGGLDQVMYMAQKRLPVLYVPGMSLGCSSPITFAGSIALGMADSFVGMLVGQLTRPGTPFIACNYTDNVNMRTVTTNYSHPEFQLVHAGSADVYRYLGIPFSANVGATSCGMFNQQAVFEITTSLYTSILSGVNLSFSLGALEGGKSSSMEALIFCDQCAGFLKRIIEGIEISEYTLAEDTINEVGPGGMFLAEESTLEESKKFWESSTLVGMTYDEIIAQGAPDMNMRLNQRAKEIIAEGPRNPLSEDVIKQLDHIVGEAEKRIKSVQ